MCGCIKRLTDVAVANGFTILEKHQALCSPLQEELLRPYSAFLRATVECMFFCGFVPFTVRRIEGVPVPQVLPLGSFAWSCEISGDRKDLSQLPETYQAPHLPGSDNSQQTRKKQKTGHLLEYRVRMLTNVCRDEDVVVVPWIPPMIEDSGIVCSPVNGLLARYLELEKGHELLNKAVKWNSERHIVVTERVDLKDQTSSGIQLLDEFRRYNMTGEVLHYNQVRRLRMQGQDKTNLKTVNDARIHWAQQQFSDDNTGEATVHVMPPNTDIQELQSIDLASLGVESYEEFRSNVLEFFNMTQLSDTAKAGNSTDTLTRSLHDTAQNIASFLETAVVAGYAECFNLPRREVRCKVRPQSRLAIDGSEDIKKLTEAGHINPAHGEKVREMFGMRKDVDRKGGNGRGNGFMEKQTKDDNKNKNKN